MQLLKEIEQEVEAKEKAQKGESTTAADDQGASPLVGAAALKTEGEDGKAIEDGKVTGDHGKSDVKMESAETGAPDAEGDVKMDDK